MQAARYAHVFGQDVCAVLADEDDDNLLVRIAAAMVIDRDERAREEQSRRSMKK